VCALILRSARTFCRNQIRRTALVSFRLSLWTFNKFVCRNVSALPLKADVALMQEACLKRVTSGCSRLAQSWSDLLSGADVFDGLSVILVRTMSGRPDSGNALPLHLRDRHQHTSVYLFHPFSCPVLTLVQLSDGERFLYSRRLQRDAQAGSAINDSNRRSTAGASCVPKSVIKITAPRSESQDCRDK
jgi:hypothetical protein